MRQAPPFSVPTRAKEAHKNSCGRVLLVAGSGQYPGAGGLAAMAALKAGAGRVTWASTPAALEAPSSRSAAIIGVALKSQASGRIAYSARQQIEALLAGHDVLVIGPGLGLDEDLAYLCADILLRAKVPCVVDADALNGLAAIAGFERLEADRQSPWLVTPHLGEARRILGQAEIAEPQEILQKLSEKTGACVLLKGAETLVADQHFPKTKRDVYRNHTGHSGMAVAGMGDLLSGLIAALIAQGLTVFEAACLGAWLHGHAADLALRDSSFHQASLIPEDVLDFLPFALEACV